MKIRKGFVSNSSSTAYIITNRSNIKKKLSDFVEENGRKILRDFRAEFPNDPLEDFDGFKINFEDIMKVAKSDSYDYVWQPKEAKYCVFGDEQRNKLGLVFDYALRGGGSSKNWIWKYKEALR